MELFGDGWYSERSDAEAALDTCTAMGALPVGVIESSYGTWGILYWSTGVLFENHRMTKDNALAHARRPSSERMATLKAWKDGDAPWPGPDVEGLHETG